MDLIPLPLCISLFCLSWSSVGGIERINFITPSSTGLGEGEEVPDPICGELSWGSVLRDDEILDRIQTMVPDFERKGLEPAIPLQQLGTYRQLPLTDCKVEPSGQLSFQIDVPVKTKNQDYQLFNFPKGSFSFEAGDGKGICVFEYPTKGIVETSAASSIYPLTEAAWTNCLQTNICQIPTPEDVDQGDLLCLQALFSGKAGRELAPFCKFHCQPHPHSNPNPTQEERKKEISDSFFLSWILK